MVPGLSMRPSAATDIPLLHARDTPVVVGLSAEVTAVGDIWVVDVRVVMEGVARTVAAPIAVVTLVVTE